MSLNTSELIVRVRRNAFIRDNHPDYPDLIILDELNDALRSIYLDIMSGPRQGYWLKQKSFTFGPNVQVRVDPRSIASGLEKVEIGEVNGQLYTINEITENHAGWYESFAGRTGTPQYFVLRGDTIDFLPDPDRTLAVRLSFYSRPNILVAAQANANSGFITAIDNTLKTITVSLQPVFKTDFASTPAASIGTGFPCDIVRWNNSCEVVAMDITPNNLTGAGPFVYTFPAGTDLSGVRFKDYLRGANESDWPQLPEEFHRTVADVASVKIMLELNMASKASQIASSVGGDLQRLRSIVATSRTRNSPKLIGLSMITFGGGRKAYPRFP